MSQTSQEKFTLAKVKAEHKAMKLGAPEEFNKERLKTIGNLVDALKTNAPNWGGLHLTLFSDSKI